MNFLPFGSDDPSVIRSGPLTSSSAADMAQASTIPGTLVFDSTEGVHAAVGGLGPIWGFTVGEELLLQAGGQFRFEIPTIFFSNTTNAADGPSGSNGYDHTAVNASLANEHLFIWNSTGTFGGAGDLQCRLNFTSGNQVDVMDDTGSLLSNIQSGDLADLPTTVFEVTWDATTFWIYKNDKLWATEDYTTAAGMFNFLQVGGEAPFANRSLETQFYKNFQIATIQATFDNPDGIRRGIVGDSLAEEGSRRFAPSSEANSNSVAGTPLYGQTFANFLDADDKERGIEPDWFFGAVGGTYVSEIQGDLGAGKIIDQVNTILASNLTELIMLGGTNDCLGSSLTADFRSSLDTIVSTVMGNATITKFTMGNVPTTKGDTAFDLPANVANVAAANQHYIDAALVWRAANPSSPKLLLIADRFGETGGENPAVGTLSPIRGLQTGGDDNLHFSSTGQLNTYTAIRSASSAVMNPPVLLTGYFDQFNDIGNIVSVDVSTNITGGASFNAQGLPDGLTIDQASGEITGTVTHNGDFSIIINSRNANGNMSPPGQFNWFVGAQAKQFSKLEQIGPNGNWYSYQELGLTLAEMNSAYFSNRYVAPTLKTGDILMVNGSDGTTLYTVTVVTETRTVTLSTGLVIT